MKSARILRLKATEPGSYKVSGDRYYSKDIGVFPKNKKKVKRENNGGNLDQKISEDIFFRSSCIVVLR